MNAIVVRPWDEEDALALYQMSMHPYYAKKRILHYLYPDSFLHAIATIHFYQQADPTRFIFRAIVFKKQVCGYLQAEKKNTTRCELSYWLGVDYWNQGIMEEALQDVCEQIFKQMDVMEIYARVQPENIASQHVLLKNGFHMETIEHMLMFRKYK